MFWFLACIATPTGGVNCTAPTLVESPLVCQTLEDAYRGAAQVIFRTVAVTSRCLSKAPGAESGGPLNIPLPPLKLP